MEIKDIKEQLSITEVLAHYGLYPNKNNMLCCPFHADKTPSLQIYPKTNTYCCFSSNCTAGTGDVIQFIELKEKQGKHQAIMKAKELLHYTPHENNTTLLARLWAVFTNSTKQIKEVVAYIEQRSLKPEGIGFNAGRYHYRAGLSNEDIQQCLSLGLLLPIHKKIPDTRQLYRSWAKDCIIFPLKDKQGRVVNFYGRSITGTENEKHYYMRNRKGLYPHYPKAGTEKLILTEAVIDAATLLQVPEITKQYEVLALYGTNGLTEEHKQAITALTQLKEIILFMDGDQAGIKAVEKYSKELQLRPGLSISSVKTPEGEDVNSLVQGHDAEILTHLLEQRQVLHLVEKAEPLILPEKSDEKKKEEKRDSATKPEQSGKMNTENPERIIYETEELYITIWGGIEQDNLTRLRISLHIQSKADRYKSFRDDTNLYSHSATLRLIRQIAETLEISTATVGHTITALTEGLEHYRMEQRADRIKAMQPKRYEMTMEEKQQARKLLDHQNLVQKTLELIGKTGLVGEEKNGLLLYFLYLSRLLDDPLHAIIFGKSGSGKTYLQTRISECLPEESVRNITSLTENVLYYSPKNFWKHKVLLIEDLDGVYNAFLPLREFMSKQSITKLTTDKDPKGNNVQKLLHVEGPICVSGATTKENVYEDNANRSFLLHINEGSEHAGKVMDYQRRMQAGQIDEAAQQKAKQQLKNAQRLLQKIKVINPYAPQLYLPDCLFKKLRTNMHYLKLIEIITFYHQHQREVKQDKNGSPYIETAIEDIAWANRLVKESLLRKSDELSGQLREFFESLKMHNEQGKTFFAKDLRKNLRMHPMKLSRYLEQLEQRGYIKRTGGGRQSGYEYKITEWEEYSRLQENIGVLDKKLEELHSKNQKTNGSHIAFTPHSQNSM